MQSAALYGLYSVRRLLGFGRIGVIRENANQLGQSGLDEMEGQDIGRLYAAYTNPCSCRRHNSPSGSASLHPAAARASFGRTLITLSHAPSKLKHARSERVCACVSECVYVHTYLAGAVILEMWVCKKRKHAYVGNSNDSSNGETQIRTRK
jgi:hypothetical protein